MATFVSGIALSIIVLATLYDAIETSTRESCLWWASWLQFIGLSGIACWAAWRLYDVMHGAPVSAQQLLAHCCLAAFALGYSLERWNAHQKPHMPGAMTP